MAESVDSVIDSSTTSDQEPLMSNEHSNAASESVIADLLREIFYSPMNLALLAIICFLVYKIVRDRTEVPSAGTLKPAEPELPKLRRDFTIQELRQYDGNQTDGRVLVAVNGNVYDVTKGKRFYGPGGPYASFAGRDASRNLATFSVVANEKEDYDDLSDLSVMEMDSVREWEMQFKEKYEYVGKLLRKGEQPTNYDDEEDIENSTNENTADNNAEVLNGEGLRQRKLLNETVKETIASEPSEEESSKSNISNVSHISLDKTSSTSVLAGQPSSTDC